MAFKKTEWKVCDYCDLVFMPDEIAYEDTDGLALCVGCQTKGIRVLNEFSKYDKRKVKTPFARIK